MGRTSWQVMTSLDIIHYQTPLNTIAPNRVSSCFFRVLVITTLFFYTDPYTAGPPTASGSRYGSWNGWSAAGDGRASRSGGQHVKPNRSEALSNGSKNRVKQMVKPQRYYRIESYIYIYIGKISKNLLNNMIVYYNYTILYLPIYSSQVTATDRCSAIKTCQPLAIQEGPAARWGPNRKPGFGGEAVTFEGPGLTLLVS